MEINLLLESASRGYGKSEVSKVINSLASFTSAIFLVTVEKAEQPISEVIYYPMKLTC